MRPADSASRKPLDVADLLAMLVKWVHCEPDPIHSTDHVMKTGGEVKSAVNTIDIFDVDAFVRRNLGDLELSRDLSTIFCNCAPEYMESIRTSLAVNDAVSLRQSAHKLKGPAAILSLSSLTEIAGLIESYAAIGDLENAGQLLPELELRLEHLVIRKLSMYAVMQEQQSKAQPIITVFCPYQIHLLWLQIPTCIPLSQLNFHPVSPLNLSWN